jgi:GntR family transcriptional regulator, transcriptional repressor for pyruvate dehydrogenase complex
MARKEAAVTIARGRSAAGGALQQEARRGMSTASNTLAQKLHDAIVAGELPIGSSLGSERDLKARFDCGRATVREALRVLRGQGLVEVRRGRTGGWFISQPSQVPVIQSLDRLIHGTAFRWADLLKAREAIEAGAAEQAAAGADADKLERLREASVECEQALYDMPAFVIANLNWHMALAEASGNPLFVAFLTSLSKAMHEAIGLEEFDVQARKAVVGNHWQIYRAIEEHDVDAARRRTLRHLGAYRRKPPTTGRA